MPEFPPSVTERFWSHVDKTSDCWLWTASTNQSGYGRINVFGNTVQAHRLSMIFRHGGIPEGAQVNHNCDNTRCVNPDHLYFGTHEDNMKDRSDRGRHPNQVKSECRNGHPLTDQNTYTKPNGARNCRVCRREAERRYELRKVG